MPEFRFHLETLLRLRRITRDECRLRLAESQRADAALQEQLSALAAESNRLRAQCREVTGPGVVDLDRLAGAERYATLLRTKQDELQRARETLAVEIQSRRVALLEADRDAKALEKLRERQKHRHRREAERHEMKRLDEAIMPRYSARCA